jgi:1D-myo-inositol 3-kinase
MPTNASAPVDFLIIGHVTRDIPTADPAATEYILGGTVSFAAVTAARLGRHPTVLTRAGNDVDLSAISAVGGLYVLPSQRTTTFANIYTSTGRVQYCYTPAPVIAASDVPDALRRPKVVLLGPLVQEIEPDMIHVFAPETVVAAVPQGWMRRWDADGRVHPTPWANAAEFLPDLDALILSIEDVDGDLSIIEEYCTHVPLLVMTQYREGSTVYQRQSDGTVTVTPVPPRPAHEVDPTGAGDTFATAFLLRLQETGDPLDAARYANVTASFGVEGPGISAIPSHAEVLAYMAAHPWPTAENA